ncbi:nucleotidyl transferase AbiEii/AbiGii toxin family protein [Methylocystis sp. MJC1]|uniref:nucleotidyl transferase AbiEii/AbiGii toxin family protein n=1 Tax=Methylocystis sp. MJC1 TaxID=2654282 RepID=UPI0013EA0469|nr:nucleotidyl transferase AbiEii/AbiGii toxin family protein [Methylocystis sp. MJC1]MBU6527994.1 nucleotidyl transferase AbiEii/AbiGii toxin family protein [Methylocystis sp. MJC1]UZX10913.1 nucleotidyl transferase AbiEii/AbiGii toxin family protein [Methylocystis sp. MJC1]
MTEHFVLDHEKITNALSELGSIIGATLQRSVTVRIYGGSALILASNFRRTTFDIDFIGNKIRPVPQLLKDTRRDSPENDFLVAAAEIVGKKFGYKEGWFNYQVARTISGAFDHHDLAHHEPVGRFPETGHGLEVHVPSLDYILAMKLQAQRIKPAEEYKDLRDLICLTRIKGDEIKNPDDLIEIHARFYRPRQRRMDFEDRIEQLWEHHITGKVPVAVRRAGIPAAPRYLGYGRS